MPNDPCTSHTTHYPPRLLYLFAFGAMLFLGGLLLLPAALLFGGNDLPGAALLGIGSAIVSFTLLRAERYADE